MTELKGTALVLGAELNAHTARIEADIEATVSSKLSEFSTTFSTAQDERRSSFQEDEARIEIELRKLSSQSDEFSEQNQKTLAQLHDGLDAEKSAFIKKSNAIISELRGLYEAAGQTALSAGFAGSAEAEKRSFETYSKAAIVIFGVAGVLLGTMWFALAKEEGFKFVDLLLRVPVAAVFLIPAFYVASLANRHRKSAVKLRSLSLRIAAFDAFVVNLDPPKRVELREIMMKEFFEEKVEDLPAKQPLFGFGGKQVDSIVAVLDKTVDKLGG